MAVSAATRTVTNLNDDGPGSLRETIRVSAPGDAIDFFGSGTIVLTTGELAIGRSLTILGPATGMAVSGNDRSRVFNISGGTVVLSNLVIRNGRMAGIDGFNEGGGYAQGGGILNSGSLSPINCTLHANVAAGGRGDSGPFGGGDGGGAFGGAICNLGTLALLNCTFDSNSALGGDGFINGLSAYNGGNAYGGAVCSDNIVALVNCTLREHPI